MNARTYLTTDRTVVDSFVFASSDDAHARWIARALGMAGKVDAVALEPAAVGERVGQQMPSLLLVDFSQDRKSVV